MNLFKSSDIPTGELIKKNPVLCSLDLDVEFKYGAKLAELMPALETLKDNKAIFFMTDGAWSNIDIVDALLKISGPADVHFCTWSISIDAIRKFTEWQDSGAVSNVHAIMDQGIRNRKPEIYQQATVAFKNLRLIKCHAKVDVISNSLFSFIVIGSANKTNNPRKEAGMILNNHELVNQNLKWMRKEFGYAYS